MFDIVASFGIDPAAIAGTGIWLIALIVFAESGLLIGFFLPGDTLLIAAGVLASQGQISLSYTIAAITIAAIIGDNVGYTIGKTSGKRLFHKKDGILFRKEYVAQAEKFYEKHGGKAIILARFTPIVRTFAPMVAGIGKMDRSKFMFYNIIGAILWATSVTSLGYFIGNKIPKIGDYLEYALLSVIVLSLAPAIYHVLKDPRSRELIKMQFRKFKRRLTKKPESEE